MELSEDSGLNLIVSHIDPIWVATNEFSPAALDAENKRRFEEFDSLAPPMESVFGDLLHNDPAANIKPELLKGPVETIDDSGVIHSTTFNCCTVTPHGLDILSEGQQTGWRLTISRYQETESDQVFNEDGMTNEVRIIYTTYDMTILPLDATNEEDATHCLYSLVVDDGGTKLTPQRADLPGSIDLDDAEVLASASAVSNEQFQESIGEFRRLLWRMSSEASAISAS